MTDCTYILGLLAVTGGITIALRALPFIFLGRGKEPAPVIRYIGNMLAPAAIAMLVVYCLADYIDAATANWANSAASWINITAPAAASVVVVGLQYWKRNSLVSIIAGTAVYMLIVQLF